MAGTLALVGGGEWSDGCTFDAELLEVSARTVVTVLPTAAAYENPVRVVAQATEWFGALGATVEVLDVMSRPDASAAGSVAQARAAAFVYVASGSPMHLRSVLKDTPLLDALVAAWNDGMVVAAAAESATVLCSHMVDTRGGAFTVGLDLLEDITVLPRADTWSEDKWHRTVKLAPSNLAVVGIDERTALIADGGAWRVAGGGAVTCWRNGHRITVADLPPLTTGS